MREFELRRLDKELQDLKSDFNNFAERINALEFEISINLATLIEENRNLKYRVDPFSPDGDSLADWD